jgi:hypothetical protein
MPEEHTGQLGFDYAWKELLARAPKAGAAFSPQESSQTCRRLISGVYL